MEPPLAIRAASSVVLLIAASVLAAPSDARETRPIVYIDRGQIRTVDPTTGASRVVTRRGLFRSYDDPAWSPSGRQIAAIGVARGPHGRDLVVMNADGTEERRLTRDSANEAVPAWSPDGRLIAYRRERIRRPGRHCVDICRTRFRARHAEPEYDIWTIRPSGRQPHRLTGALGGWRWVTEVVPAWSPDGQYLAFTTQRNDSALRIGDHRAWIVRRDGSGLRALAHARSDPPIWIGGKPLLARMNTYTQTPESCTSSFLFISFDLTTTPDTPVFRELAGYWSRFSASPDGHEILASAGCGPAAYGDGLAVISANLTTVGAVNGTTSGDDAATWSPDGTQVAFVRNPEHYTDPIGDIWVADLLAASVHRLTDSGHARLPMWATLAPRDDGTAHYFP